MNKFATVLPSRLYLRLYRKDYKRTQPEVFDRLQEMRRGVTDDGYSFKSFDETRSIFVHVPKCAGVSICQALYGNLAGGHTALADYMAAFEPACLLNYFKFTVVRNPWDRLVSAYQYLKSGGMNEADRSWAAEHLSGYEDFRDFVHTWLNRDNIWKRVHFFPQRFFILDPHHKLAIDYVGRFETLSSDFRYIADSIGINATLPFTNESRRQVNYRSYYDDETRSIVASVYHDDIRLLRYEF